MSSTHLHSHNWQQNGGDARAGERGQTGGEVVCGQRRALLAARVQGHDGGQRRERAGADATMTEATIIIMAFAPNHCGM